MTRIRPIRFLLLMASFGIIGSAAHGQDPIPAVEQSVEAWYAVRDWVSEFSVPDEIPPRPVEHASGCSIMLRQGGRLVGTGSARSNEERMLHLAAKRALREVLADPAVASIPDDLRNELGARLTVELEFAGPMQPLIGDAPSEFTEDIHPLRHGLALRVRDQWTVRYPSRLRNMNRWADTTMLDGMALSMGLTSGLRNALSRSDVVAYRFQTIDLAQSEPDAAPQVVMGGTMNHPPSVPTRSDVVDALDALLAHIEGRLWSGDEPLGLMGNYEPARDRFDPLVAPVRDQAVTAWALGRLAATPRVDGAMRDRAADAAAEILVGMLGQLDVEGITIAGDAAILLAMETNRTLDPERLDAMIASRRELLRTRIRAAVEGESIPSNPDLAFIGFVLLANPAEDDCELAKKLVDHAWRNTAPSQQVSLLPWIAWAEFEMPTCDTVPSEDALRTLRGTVLDRQVPPNDERFGPELAGGIVLGESVRDVTAQSLRAFASMPSMLQQLNPVSRQERAEQSVRLSMAIRYLLQLQMESDDAMLHRSSKRVLGGIRMAPWDSRMPTIAQALALLTLSETLAGLPSESPVTGDGPGLY